MCAFIAAAASSCSLVVGGQTADQCQVVADCAHFAGLRTCAENVCLAITKPPACAVDADCAKYADASCSAGVCVKNGSSNGCKLNADCSGMGPYYICNKATAACVSLTSTECTTVYATKTPASVAYNDDSAVIFGAINPTQSSFGPDASYGKLVEDSIKLAIDDFAMAGGIPGLTGAAFRPIVLVGCGDGANEDQTDKAAKHLSDIGVPAIIGYPFSGSTITLANDVTIPDNIVLFSSAATSAQITALVDKNLVWRTAPSDNIQATALAAYYADVEVAAKAKYPMIAGNPIKVAIVNHSDAYGSGLGDSLEAILKFNGQPATSQTGTNYLRVNYGKSSAPDLTKLPLIVSFQPDIIFEFGLQEGPDVIFKQVEKQWAQAVPADGHFPFWVFSDGGEVSSLWSTTPAMGTMPAVPADIATEDQRERVTGSVPGVSTVSWPPYGTFLTEFSSSSYSAADGSADTLGPAGAYDILYLLAYSTVMLGKNPLTGPNLVKYGLSQMNQPQSASPIKISRGNILPTFPLLGAGGPISITGVSGSLPFDKHGDVSKADIQIWCVPKGKGMPDPGAAFLSSGRFYNSSTNKMDGSISAACGL